MMLKNKTLLLIDGSSYIYRAFHAIRPLSNDRGEATNAVYGVLNMLKKIQNELSFDYCSFVYDAKGKNFRHELYHAYKATRKPMPDDLKPQIEWIKMLVDLMGWNVLVVEGVEADDVIATLKKMAQQQKMKVIISTGDKDLAQLVDEETIIINTMTDEKLDIEGVKKKYGVYPKQMIDFLTLVGDVSDNIKGVDKCGEKTAVKWLEKYDNLDNLFVHIHEIPGKIGENLRIAKDWLFLAHQLISLKSDVVLSEYLPHGIEDLTKKAEDWNLLLPQLKRLGFKKWIKEAEDNLKSFTLIQTPMPELLPTDLVTKSYLKPRFHYQTVDTRELFQTFKKDLENAKYFGFDTETTSLNEMQARLIGMSFALEKGKAFYIPVGHNIFSGGEQLNIDWVLSELAPIFKSEQIKKIGQNLKYDKHVLQNHGIILNGIAGDSMLASYIVESHLGHSLDELSDRHLGLVTVKYEDLCGKGKKQISFADVSISQATEYACQDADFSMCLESYLVSLMNQNQKKIYQDLELPLLDILYRMERYGVLLDKQELQKQSHDLASRILAIQKEVFSRVQQEFNLNSPQQLQEILFGVLKIPTKGIKKTPKGAISTSEEVLEQLASDFEVPKLILEYRTLIKLKTTYTDKLPLMMDENGRVHTTYAQAVVNTGRLASNHPNLQNIPVRTQEGRQIRQAFIAPEQHVLVSADYSQIELRIMAHLSGDQRLMDAFQKGEDIHKSTASEIFHVPLEVVTTEQRRYAKTINFGLIYGMSQYGLAKSLGISHVEAKSFIEQYFNQYPNVLKYMEITKLKASQEGFVETVFGRKLYLMDIHSSNGNLRMAAERAAINAPMQGTASDLIKMAMIQIQKWLDQCRLNTKMIMQVHDELIFEVPNEEIEIIMKNIPHLMVSVARLKVPLVVDIGYGVNWDAAH